MNENETAIYEGPKSGLKVYEYSGLNGDDKPITNTLQAKSLADARSQLERMGIKNVIHVTKVRSPEEEALYQASCNVIVPLSEDEKEPPQNIEGGHPASSADKEIVLADPGFFSRFLGEPRLTGERLYFFCRQFGTLLDAGIPLTQCLDVLEKNEPDERVKAKLGLVAYGISTGQSLTKCLASSGLLNDEQLAKIEFGETSGSLGECLLGLTQDEEKRFAFSTKVWVKLRQPILVLLVLWLGLPFLLFQVSKVGLSLLELGGGGSFHQGFFTLLGNSWFLGALWLLPLATVVSWYLFTLDPRRSEILLGWFEGLPWLNGVISNFRYARLLRMLSELLETGFPLLSALRLCEKVTCSTACTEAAKKIQEGTPLSLAFDQLLPDRLVSLLSIAEDSGKQPKMLELTALVLEETAIYQLEIAIEILEPVVLAGVSLLVGGICLLGIWPMVSTLERLTL